MSLPAVLSRTAPADAETIDLPDPLGGAERRLATATIPCNGLPLRFTSLHLRNTERAGRLGLDRDYRAAGAGRLPLDGVRDDGIRRSVEIRLEQLAAVEERLGAWPGQPHILTGDLNFLPDGLEYRRIIGWGLADAWRAAPRLGSGATILERNPLVGDGPRAYAEQAAPLLPGSTGDLDYTLDYQFHSPGLRPGAAWTLSDPGRDGAWPSDHLGHVVDYTVESPE
ncbi:endonuclease/exonuclease/phosphatase family protein [Leifsonia xyli]|uniref:endonuclease/exonuclease/phosphatase family protein n=1 Tax=Leifsonia xyli TaxID=1575 RepID=UPI000AD4C63E|nr:endonuclease/exonuclease/phosphatase family protein [Leifsonia xyli]